MSTHPPGPRPATATARILKLWVPLAAAVLVASALALNAYASTGTTERVSVDSAGTEANGFSSSPDISGDGRFVAFYSTASNLVAGDTNARGDIFVRDRQTGGTERVSVDSGGTQGNLNSTDPAISADGRLVAFASQAPLVAGDTNSDDDIFVRDRQTATTERVSVDSAGTQANGFSVFPDISADGRFVTFGSIASNLVAGDTNGRIDIFVRDLQTDTTERVSVNSSGSQTSSDGCCVDPSISADGRFVTFTSDAPTLVAGDTNGLPDTFVRDRQSATTERVSVDTAGSDQNDVSLAFPDISGDGRFVAFTSGSSDLVAGDANNAVDIFVRDRQAGTTELISMDSANNQADAMSDGPAVSADGRFVAFESFASNLVAADTNGLPDVFAADIFVRDRQAGTTERVSVDSAGTEANGHSDGTAITGDGRFVAFGSEATNLVAADTNGLPDVFVRDRSAPTEVNSASETLPAGGGTVSTNTEATPGDPVGTSVTSPVGGDVSISEGPTTESTTSGYSFLGQQVDVSAPAASAAVPLALVFRLDASLLPADGDASTLQVFRNGLPVADCSGPAGTASPDPCVSSRQTLAGDDVELTILTSQASHWNFGLHVAYPFSGFFSPLTKQPPSFNSAQPGSSVPVKFGLGGDHGLGVLASGSPRSLRIDCTTGDSLGGESPTAGKLTYERRANQYVYTWKTQKAWSGAPDGPCRQLDVRLIDGSHHRVNVKFAR